MERKPLIVVSICAVVLLLIASLSNVVGYQSVQTSQQNLINERINQRELLFQTIVDIANNKEIQRIILKSQMSRGIFPTSDLPVITKQHIRQMYLLGLILSKVISKSRIHSLIGEYQFNNQEMQKEISAVIDKDAILNRELTQLQNSECDCENEESPDRDFPLLCKILYVLALPALMIMVLTDILAENPLLRYSIQILGFPFDLLWLVAFFISIKLNCWDFIP